MKKSKEETERELTRNELYYIYNLLKGALDDWADRKISDAKFYGLIQFRLNDIETLRQDLNKAVVDEKA